MAKGYLYDNGDELITREEALPSVSASDNGKVLTVSNGEWGAVFPAKDIKNSVLLKVDDSSDKLRFTPYAYDGTAITVGDLLNYADDNGMVVCRLVPSNSGNHKYSGNVICIHVKEADDTTKVDIMIPYVWIYTEDTTYVYLYLTTGANIVTQINKTASNFKDTNSIKLTIAKS